MKDALWRLMRRAYPYSVWDIHICRYGLVGSHRFAGCVAVTRSNGHYATVSIIIEFFVAPDDAAASEVLDAGPEGVFESLAVGNFEVDEALIEWESIVTGRSFEELASMDQPRVVAEAASGSLVFAVSPALRDELATAAKGRLDELASEWVLRQAGEGTEFEPDLAKLILGDLAGLARSANRQKYELYCWMT
jgi:hypothetical protein